VTRTRAASILALLIFAACLAAAGRPLPAAASPYPSPTVELAGHGWGHGRGMGQYGALGYATQGWQYPQILDHFYGGTQSGQNPAPSMSVRLTGFDGADTIVFQEQAHLTTSVDGGAARYAALRAHLIGPNQFELDSGPTCQGPWTLVQGSTAGPVTFSPAAPTPSGSIDRSELLQGCLPAGGTQWLRGSVRAVDAQGQGDAADQRTVNDLGMEDYLLGVVPSESPASWGDVGGGAGMEALKAQAVAARSYAASQNRYPYAKICDTDSCQVYRGRAIQSASGSYRDVEDPRATAAVNATAGQVRVTGGQVVSTEFSSSTGGYTAGGRFPAVTDDGDAVSLNPYHNWDVTVSVSTLESAYAGIGNLVWLQVTQRNALGDLGGRVTQVQIQGTAGVTTTTGDDFAARLGLRSNWFRVVYPGGYWIAGADGGVFSFGNAQFFGSTGGIRLAKPIVGIEATPSRQGYWLVASDGGVFSFGDAAFFGSTGGIRLNKPVVGMAGHRTGLGVTATALGYWMVASDGGIFAFGDAGFFGSTGGIRLNQPIVGMAPTPTGQGYWMVASDGGIFAFGDAGFFGSTGGIRLNQPVTAMSATPTGAGYYMLGRDGGIFNFGDAAFFGAVPGLVKGPAAAIPKVGMAISQTR
jgi:SpoIID/LytB domain protein